MALSRLAELFRTARGSRPRRRTAARVLFCEWLEERALLAVAPLSETFLLHSNPGADQTIYLDFDGHITSGTIWNSNFNGGADIVTPAYDTDGNAAFSNAELERIQQIWQRTSEDFIPFDVDVTTEDPGSAALAKSGGGDSQWGIRVVIGGSSYDWFGAGAGGVAYVGSFNWSSDTPTFVFEEQLGNGYPKYTAEAASHETGHTLGLSHDGRTVPHEEYYSGQGSGATGWAPIMGVGYYQPLTQWSKGEYLNASQTQDDLAIITSQNGFGYRADDHGNASGTADPLSVAPDGVSVSGDGIIETNSDFDVFSFTSGAGTISLNVDPAPLGPNLDILAELYDADGTLVGWSNPAGRLDADISVDVPGGDYYLSITGVGLGDPLDTGYTDYASLGSYSIAGTIVPSNTGYLSVAAADAVKPEGDTGSTAFTFTVTRSGNVSGAATVDYSVAGSGADPAGAADFDTGEPLSGTVSFADGETSKPITVLVAGDGDFEADEQFTVTLAGASGETETVIAGAAASGTILNDDAAPAPAELAIAATDASKAEGNDGTTTDFVFTITRSGGGHATRVDFAVTSNGRNGADGADFDGGVMPGGTISFGEGQTSYELVLQVSGDTTDEKNEGFTVTLSNPGDNTVITADTASGTIVDDDGKGGGGGGGGNNGGGNGGGHGGGKPNKTLFLHVAPMPNFWLALSAERAEFSSLRFGTPDVLFAAFAWLDSRLGPAHDDIQAEALPAVAVDPALADHLVTAARTRAAADADVPWLAGTDPDDSFADGGAERGHEQAHDEVFGSLDAELPDGPACGHRPAAAMLS